MLFVLFNLGGVLGGGSVECETCGTCRAPVVVVRVYVRARSCVAARVRARALACVAARLPLSLFTSHLQQLPVLSQFVGAVFKLLNEVVRLCSCLFIYPSLFTCCFGSLRWTEC